MDPNVGTTRIIQAVEKQAATLERVEALHAQLLAALQAQAPAEPA